MFTRDMENWLYEMDVQDGYHAELLKGILQDRNFSAHSNESNITYAFEMTRWVGEHFEYLTYASSNEIDGMNLPESIKVIIAYDWQPSGEMRIVYPPGSKLSLRPKTEELRVSRSSTLERIIHEAINEGENMNQVLDTAGQMVTLDPGLIEEHTRLRNDTVKFESTDVIWEHPLDNKSGLTFTVSPSEIKVTPFADREYAEKLYDFTANIRQNTTTLAETVCELAVIAAQNCMPRGRTFFTDRLEIEDFKKRLADI